MAKECWERFRGAVEFEVGCMEVYGAEKPGTLGKLAREMAEPLRAALDRLSETEAEVPEQERERLIGVVFDALPPIYDAGGGPIDRYETADHIARKVRAALSTQPQPDQQPSTQEERQ